MRARFKTAKGFHSIDLEDPAAEIYESKHPVFKVVEKEFNDYMEYADRDTIAAYNELFEDSNSPYLCRESAIIEGIDAILDDARVSNTRVITDKFISRVDLIGVFQS